MWPSAEHLPSYVQELKSGWSPDSTRGAQAIADQLAQIAADTDAFLAGRAERNADGEPIHLPDGQRAQRLPGLRRWMGDGECSRARSAVTQKVKVVVGAKARIHTVQPAERSGQLRFLGSKLTIEANRGVLVERFAKPEAFGGTQALRYRVPLP